MIGSRLLEAVYDRSTIQGLLGHSDVRTTIIYTHVSNRGGHCVRSPVDALGLNRKRYAIWINTPANGNSAFTVLIYETSGVFSETHFIPVR